MDRDWWQLHHDEVARTFLGARYSNNPLSSAFQVVKLPQADFKTYGNSGAAAITLAVQGGAARVILLGYDVQKTDGKAHWHGDHPPQLGNAGQIQRWHGRFAEQAADFGHVQIINCSRQTALTCWPRMDLEDALTT